MGAVENGGKRLRPWLIQYFPAIRCKLYGQLFGRRDLHIWRANTATLENTILVDSNATNCESNGGTIVDGGDTLDDDGTAA